MKTNQELKSRRRSLRSKAAARRRVSQPGYDGLAATQQARRGYWQKLMDEVDPDCSLPENIRLDRAKALFAARMMDAKADAITRRLRGRRRAA